jgi:hypothetical protein
MNPSPATPPDRGVNSVVRECRRSGGQAIHERRNIWPLDRRKMAARDIDFTGDVTKFLVLRNGQGWVSSRLT